MKHNYKVYNYCEDNKLITRTEQIKNHIDEKFKHLDIDIDDDVIKDTIKDSIDNAIGESFQDTIENNIKETITESLGCVDKHLHHINCHIECAKNTIVDKIEEHNHCLFNVATKDDIEKAVDLVNTHTNRKFKEIDFEKKFSDLNEQIKELVNNSGSGEDDSSTSSKVDEDIVNVLSSITGIEKEKFEDGVDSDIDLNNISIGGGTY